jgi:hypothetical protein
VSADGEGPALAPAWPSVGQDHEGMRRALCGGVRAMLGGWRSDRTQGQPALSRFGPRDPLPRRSFRARGGEARPVGWIRV